MAANFQSLMISASTSDFFMRPVMNCSSLRIVCSSRCVPLSGIEAGVSSTVDGRPDSGVLYTDLLLDINIVQVTLNNHTYGILPLYDALL